MAKQPKDLTTLVNTLARMTQINSHSDALYLIASRWDFLGHIALQLKAVVKLHNELGYMPSELATYRTALSETMWRMINEHMGREMVATLKAVL